MSGVAKNILPETSAVNRAKSKWGISVPDWVLVLAKECDLTSQRRVADRIGMSATVINRILSNSYGASLDPLEERIRGKLMAKTIECPVLGEIGSDRCIREQGLPLTYQNPLRLRVYAACRGGCQHSRLGDGK